MNDLPWIDVSHHPLQDGFAPPWASGWGQDRFGVFVEITLSGVIQRMRWIPPGRFLMGSPDDDEERYGDEGPQHEVTIEKGFWLFDTQVTQELWRAVLGENPSHFKDPVEDGNLRPVEQVSWEDAHAFCSQANGLVPGLDLSLPSEAMWEYSCRAKTTGSRYNEDLDQIAWYEKNGERQTHAVKLKQPNNWGLYDMLGNVWEWCEDDWHVDYVGAPTTSSAWKAEAQGGDRVLRGGSWSNFASGVRSAYRLWRRPDNRYYTIGFRPACGQG